MHADGAAVRRGKNPCTSTAGKLFWKKFQIIEFLSTVQVIITFRPVHTLHKHFVCSVPIDISRESVSVKKKKKKTAELIKRCYMHFYDTMKRLRGVARVCARTCMCE